MHLEFERQVIVYGIVKRQSTHTMPRSTFIFRLFWSGTRDAAGGGAATESGDPFLFLKKCVGNR